VPVSDREIDYQSLTGPVRHGRIPWSVNGFRAARTVVYRARAGKLRLPPAVADLPADLLADTSMDELALGLWLRREHRGEPPEVPAAHHLRFHAVERFLELHADLLHEEGLLRPGDDGPEPDPLLLAELVHRPFDTALTSEGPPGFDAGEVLKAVARRARGA
jgi:hypothetical protein